MDREAAMKQMREDRTAIIDAAVPPEEETVVEEAKPPVVDEHGRLHAADGTYLPGEATKPSTKDGSVLPPAADPAAAAVVPTGIKVQIPEGHPLREMGLTEFTAANDLEAQGLRASLNGYVRRQDVETMRAERDALQQKLLHREARESAQQKWQKSPEYEAAVDRFYKTKDLEDSGDLPAGTADRVWKAEVAELRDLEQKEVVAREDALVEQEMARYADEFTAEAWNRTVAVTPEIRNLPEFSRWFEEAVENFDFEATKGRYAQQLAKHETPEARAAELHELFRISFGSRLMREPAVMEEFRRQQAADQATTTNNAAATERARLEREAADRAAVDRHMKELADKRRASPPNPLAAAAATGRPDRVSVPAPSGDDLAGLSAADAKAKLKASARETWRASLPPT